MTVIHIWMILHNSCNTFQSEEEERTHHSSVKITPLNMCLCDWEGSNYT